MKNRKVKYTNKPIGKIKIVEDFLPESKELVLKKRQQKLLSRHPVENA